MDALLRYTTAYSQETLSAASQNTHKVQLLVTTSKMTTDPKQSQIWVPACLWLVWFCLLRGGADMCTCVPTSVESPLLSFLKSLLSSLLRETQNFSLSWSSPTRLDWIVSTSPGLRPCVRISSWALCPASHLILRFKYLDLNYLADSLKIASFLFIHWFSSNRCILASLSTWSAEVMAQPTLPNHT